MNEWDDEKSASAFGEKFGPLVKALEQLESEYWKTRALEAEELNCRFMESVNGPTHMGEPALGAERNDCSLTDEQILSVMHECGSCRENNEADHIEFARAILALAKGRA